MYCFFFFINTDKNKNFHRETGGIDPLNPPPGSAGDLKYSFITMTNTDQKLDMILQKLEKLEDIETKFDNFYKRLPAAEDKFVKKCEEIEENLDNKAGTDLVEKSQQKITLLEAFNSKYERNLLMQDSYNSSTV